jgi:hypothetical protein
LNPAQFPVGEVSSTAPGTALKTKFGRKRNICWKWVNKGLLSPAGKTPKSHTHGALSDGQREADASDCSAGVVGKVRAEGNGFPGKQRVFTKSAAEVCWKSG